MSLFRKEALEYHSDRLHGEISLALPLSWQLIGYTLLAALVAALVFLFSVSYARVETVRGSIVLDRGTAPIITSRRGSVAAIMVSEGQAVAAGTPLASISAEEMLAGGESAPEQTLAALGQQDLELGSQLREAARAGSAERSRLLGQMAGLRQEIARLDQQVGVQRDLVDSAATELRRIREVARNGFISRRDVLNREELLLTRRQQLSQLDQARVAKIAAIADAERTIAQAQAETTAQGARLQASRAELDRRRAEAQADRGYVLTAPMNGRVTAITARSGQPVGAGQAVMTVVPVGAVPRAELYIPSRAAGFLEVGQEVRLQMDAFPYQRFGTIPAKISQISVTTVNRPNAAQMEPVYLVTATMERPWMAAFGRRHPLSPGMTLTARIVTDRQSLLQWLFQPILAVRNR